MHLTDRYRAVVVATSYWRPTGDPVQRIVQAIRGKVDDGDFVTVSDKALSTALGNLVDESRIRPSGLASFIAHYWMRYIWVYVLGPLCHLRMRTIQRFLTYPIVEGSAHKQLALRYAGLLQALMHGSEGGIDGSNLPYSYVSLPLDNAQATARMIRNHVGSELRKDVTVVIVDTDKTYSFRGFHFTPRPKPIKGIHSCGGFLAYVIGRFFKMKRRATPVAIAGSEITAEEALEMAKIANRSRGAGAGRTVWDMAEALQVPLTGVTWDMLDKVTHQPIVIVKLHK
jgi:F420-0:gamma-glutamyl ligase-like protein